MDAGNSLKEAKVSPNPPNNEEVPPDYEEIDIYNTDLPTVHQAATFYVTSVPQNMASSRV